jgi:hypothetical protein
MKTTLKVRAFLLTCLSKHTDDRAQDYTKTTEKWNYALAVSGAICCRLELEQREQRFANPHTHGP